MHHLARMSKLRKLSCVFQIIFTFFSNYYDIKSEMLDRVRNLQIYNIWSNGLQLHFWGIVASDLVKSSKVAVESMY